MNERRLKVKWPIVVVAGLLFVAYNVMKWMIGYVNMLECAMTNGLDIQ